MKKIAAKDLEKLFAAVSQNRALYCPIEKADQVGFYRWSEGEKVRLDALQTVKSAKDLFFPQS